MRGAPHDSLALQGQSYLDDLKAYVGFTQASSDRLAAFAPRVEPHVARIIEDFYTAIQAHPRARTVITGGDEQLARLKQTLAAWLRSSLQGPQDQAYFEARARIGRAHVRIGLEQAYMFVAMNRIRAQLTDVALAELGARPDELGATLRALDQLLDIELAIMLETYRDDLVQRIRAGERLATIGQFAAGIGHELRSPLGVIDSSVYLLGRQLEALGLQDDPRLRKHLDRVSGEVARAAKTINDLLALAQSRPPQRRRLPVERVVDAATTHAHLPDGVTVRQRVPATAEVDADPDQLGHVLVNLLTNAAQAMKGEGEVVIEAHRAPHQTMIRVRDDGPGVATELRHRIFDPLFTTKADGSGLGLALCQRIAAAHGGTLVLEPSTRGACFLLTIPDQRQPAVP